jgi:ubiquinone/menaquinone biosynthesis C-methylase UbiE
MKKKACCSPITPEAKTSGQQDITLKSEIRQRYAELAKAQGGSCCGGPEVATRNRDRSCCGTSSCNSNAGYTTEELRFLPENAVSASAGCGNPTALADLKEGETVLDLGSGGGIDVFIAAKKVGPTGKAIGVDMTPEMIDLAQKNAGQSGLSNVEFRLGEIEHLPVADESVDVIISNCVINLSTDKDAVFREAYRVLKRGGRMLVSDVIADRLPKEVRENFSSWAQCVGGAISITEYTQKIRKVGFTRVEVLNNKEYSKEFISDSISTLKPEFSEADDPTVRRMVDEYTVSHAEILAVK